MRTLYLGLNCPSSDYFHYPIIRIVPRSSDSDDIVECFQHLDIFSHVIFSSQNSVKICLQFAERGSFENKTLICVGKKTAECLQEYGLKPSIIAENETSEGIVAELQKIKFLTEPKFLWPHSSLSRPVIKNFLLQNNFFFKECILYDTLPWKRDPIPDLTQFQEIVFTSPSCIEAFLQIFGPLPSNKKLSCIGPVTEQYLLNLQ